MVCNINAEVLSLHICFGAQKESENGEINPLYKTIFLQNSGKDALLLSVATFSSKFTSVKLYSIFFGICTDITVSNPNTN